MDENLVQYPEVLEEKNKTPKYTNMIQIAETKGYSLIELLIVVALLAILSSIAYFSYSQYSTDAENTKKQAELDTIQSNVELEFLKKESFPSRVNDSN